MVLMGFTLVKTVPVLATPQTSSSPLANGHVLAPFARRAAVPARFRATFLGNHLSVWWLFLRLLRSTIVLAILRRVWRNRRRIRAAVRR